MSESGGDSASVQAVTRVNDYRRLVEKPMIANYEATIASFRSENERLHEALQQLIDYVKDGCPDDGRYYVMTEAQAVLNGIKVVQPASPLRGRDYRAWLIEIGEPEGPEYFQLVDDDNWSSDHDTALHFARKQDAEKYIADVGWTRARAVEHMWPTVPSEVKEPRTAAGSLD